MTELAAFLSALPATVRLDEPLPSLSTLVQLRLPWGGLLACLTKLPLQSCHWHDGERDHLI